MSELDGSAGVFIIPGPSLDEESAIFTNVIAEADHIKGDVNDLADLLPDNWDGKFVCHLWEIEKYIEDCLAHPAEFALRDNALALYREEGVSHIAILEGPVVPPDSTTLRLGSREIKGISLMVTYCMDRQKYRLFHCGGCAFTFSKWLEMKQPEWFDAKGSGLPENPRPLN